MQFESVSTPLAVRPGDLDRIGHVNNARVLEYLEHGRWHWLRQHGLDRQTRIIPVVARIEVDYGAELFWGELRIETALLDDPDAVYKAVIEQRIYLADCAADAAAAIKARVHIAFIDASTRQLCSLDEFIEAAEPLTSAPA